MIALGTPAPTATSTVSPDPDPLVVATAVPAVYPVPPTSVVVVAATPVSGISSVSEVVILVEGSVRTTAAVLVPGTHERTFAVAPPVNVTVSSTPIPAGVAANVRY